MTGKMTKTKQIKAHLIDKGHIDSWTAIQEYGATRLSAIIFNLRKTMDIATTDITTKDRNGNTCTYADYVFKGFVEKE